MLRRWILPGLFVGALFVAVFWRQPPSNPEHTLSTFRGSTMGTTYMVKVVGPELIGEQRLAFQDAIEAELRAVNAEMSTYQADSELSRFNASSETGPVKASAPLLAVAAEAARIGRVSGGAFDVTVGPLVDAWGFGPEGEQSPPDVATVAALKQRVGLDKLTVDLAGGTLRKAQPDVRVDLSAIAKGHGVDRLAELVAGKGYSDHFVEIGGEVRTRGQNERGRVWRVGIEKPTSGAHDIQEVVALQDQSMATSGDYRNFYERDGKRISHTIDPRTGSPITHRLASVSVLHPSCATADAWATALNVLGPDEGFALAEREQLAALFIVRGADGSHTERVTAAFTAAREATQALNPATGGAPSASSE